jgi:hypothetical protein
MGGCSYDRDVGHSSSSGSFTSGGTSSSTAKAAMTRNSQHKDTLVKNRRIESKCENPIIINLDVTGSNIEFAKIVYDKAPMLYGQIEQQGYLKDFDICFSATGDANSDKYPIQVCDFDAGIKLDDNLKKLCLEGCGGGQRHETYELSAYYFTHKCDMKNAKIPFIFFIVDEAPYETLSTEFVGDIIGDSVGEDIDTKQIFRDLFRKFGGNVFIFQNNYCGSEHGRDGDTEEIADEWRKLIGKTYADHLISIKEEKSIVDLLLGTIAMVSGSRSLDTYKKDMVLRGQTDTRISTVEESLGNISKAIVPRVSMDLPIGVDSGQKKHTARRL